MPAYLTDALFVFVGLLLERQLFVLLRRARHPAGRFALHGLMGLDGLLIANTVGGLFGMGLGLNALTLPVSAGLGLPGVALMWALRYFV